MLRGGYKQQAIIAEVQRRHVPAKPDAKLEDTLFQSGASPALIAALKAEANILTENQREAYAGFSTEQFNRTQRERTTLQNRGREQQIAEQNEIQRKQGLAQQSRQIAQEKEYKEASYEQADRTYRARKKSLEDQIASQQLCINRLRNSGAREDELVTANKTLEAYKDELAHLTEPLR